MTQLTFVNPATPTPTTLPAPQEKNEEDSLMMQNEEQERVKEEEDGASELESTMAVDGDEEDGREAVETDEYDAEEEEEEEENYDDILQDSYSDSDHPNDPKPNLTLDTPALARFRQSWQYELDPFFSPPSPMPSPPRIKQCKEKGRDSSDAYQIEEEGPSVEDLPEPGGEEDRAIQMAIQASLREQSGIGSTSREDELETDSDDSEKEEQKRSAGMPPKELGLLESSSHQVVNMKDLWEVQHATRQAARAAINNNSFQANLDFSAEALQTAFVAQTIANKSRANFNAPRPILGVFTNPELLSRIVNNPSLSLADLSHFSLVASPFLPHTRAILFSSLHIKTPRALENLDKIFTSNPQLGGYVQQVTLAMGDLNAVVQASPIFRTKMSKLRKKSPFKDDDQELSAQELETIKEDAAYIMTLNQLDTNDSQEVRAWLKNAYSIEGGFDLVGGKPYRRTTDILFIDYQDELITMLNQPWFASLRDVRIEFPASTCSTELIKATGSQLLSLAIIGSVDGKKYQQIEKLDLCLRNTSDYNELELADWKISQLSYVAASLTHLELDSITLTPSMMMRCDRKLYDEPAEWQLQSCVLTNVDFDDKGIGFASSSTFNDFGDSDGGSIDGGMDNEVDKLNLNLFVGNGNNSLKTLLLDSVSAFSKESIVETIVHHQESLKQLQVMENSDQKKTEEGEFGFAGGPKVKEYVVGIDKLNSLATIFQMPTPQELLSPSQHSKQPSSYSTLAQALKLCTSLRQLILSDLSSSETPSTYPLDIVEALYDSQAQLDSLFLRLDGDVSWRKKQWENWEGKALALLAMVRARGSEGEIVVVRQVEEDE